MARRKLFYSGPRSLRKPGVSTTAARAKVNNMPKTSTARKGLEYAGPKFKQELANNANGITIGDLVTLLTKAAEAFRSPVGADGKNLNEDEKQLVSGTAVGDTTESQCLAFYRPKKAKKTEDTIYYEAIRTKKVTITTANDLQYVADRNLAVLEPPSGDTLASDTSWTNFSIRNEYDRMLLARTTNAVVGAKDTLKQNLIANFHTLESTMILRAGEAGAIVEIYDLVPKFGIGPGTYSSEVYSSDHLSPHWCMFNGYENNVAVIDTMDGYGYNQPGASPMDSTTFRRTWKLLKKTTVRMTKNSVHRHRHVFGINKSVSWDEMGQASSAGGTAPWLPTQMIIVRGYPSATYKADAVTVECQQESKLHYSSRLGAFSQVIVYNNNT